MDVETLRQIEELPDTGPGSRSRVFTKEEDEILLKYWNTKPKVELARLMRMAVNTARARYKELTKT